MLIVICSLFAAFKSFVVSVLVQMCLDFSKLKLGGEGYRASDQFVFIYFNILLNKTQ